jgi:hypothetical protein
MDREQLIRAHDGNWNKWNLSLDSHEGTTGKKSLSFTVRRSATLRKKYEG